MATVTVTPEAFELVEFDAGVIRSIAEELATLIGLQDDVPITVEVDETVIMPRVESSIVGNAITISVTGGALEDLHKARTLSPERTRLILGTHLLRARDRLDPAWAEAPTGDELTVQHTSAWDTYTEGRLQRLGLPTRQQRRIYHFRLRHGFSDDIDGVFQRLWDGENLSWSDVEKACEETAALKSNL
ncbi:MAG TPA: hypothetical protein VM030_09390 [Acidimicrobiales bacterium]|nr:hypothetical protein [Acidimicrobiales bacterium]